MGPQVSLARSGPQEGLATAGGVWAPGVSKEGRCGDAGDWDSFRYSEHPDLPEVPLGLMRQESWDV
eukprot:6417802-Pyramimonas_sp.AAC.1